MSAGKRVIRSARPRAMGTMRAVRKRTALFGIIDDPSIQGAPNAHSRDTQGRSDLSRTLTILSHLLHLIDWHRRLAALVDAFLLSSLDTDTLSLKDETALHLSHH